MPTEATTAPAPGASTQAANETATTQAPPPPPALTTEPAKTTAEDAAEKIRESGRNAFFDSILAKRKPAAEKKTDPDPSPDPDASANAGAQAPAAAAPDPAAPKKDEASPAPAAAPAKKITTRPKTAEIDHGKLIKDAAAAGADAAMRAQGAAKKPEQAQGGSDTHTALDLPQEVLDELDVYTALQELKPKEYGNILKRFSEFNQKESGYIRKWEREHPGQSFDKESDDHEDFYSEHEPEVSDADFRKALRAVSKREAMEEINPKIDEMNRKMRASEIEPRARTLTGAVVKGAMEGLDPDKDPIAKQIHAHTQQVADQYVGTIVRLFEKAEAYDDKNPVHKEILDIALSTEREILALPEESQLTDDGRTFVPRQEFLAMTEAQQKRHWSIGADELAHVIKGNLAASAKRFHESEQKRLDEWAAQRGFVKADASKGSQAAPAAQAAAPAPAAPQAAAPSVGTRPALPGKAAGQPTSTKSWKDSFGVSGV